MHRNAAFAAVNFVRAWEADPSPAFARSIALPFATQVIPPVPSLFTLLRPFFPRFFSFFVRFHRLAETVPSSPKPKPRAKKQLARGPRGENSPLRSTRQALTKGSPGCLGVAFATPRPLDLTSSVLAATSRSSPCSSLTNACGSCPDCLATTRPAASPAAWSTRRTSCWSNWRLTGLG